MFGSIRGEERALSSFGREQEIQYVPHVRAVKAPGDPADPPEDTGRPPLEVRGSDHPDIDHGRYYKLYVAALLYAATMHGGEGIDRHQWFADARAGWMSRWVRYLRQQSRAWGRP